MLQTRFKEGMGELPEGKKSEFYEVIKSIYSTLYQEVNNRILFEQLIEGKVLERTDTALRKAPRKVNEGKVPVYISRFGNSVDEIFITAPELRKKYNGSFGDIPPQDTSNFFIGRTFHLILTYREGETDLVIPALSVRPSDVARMRRDGGGLICVSIYGKAADKLGLPFISDILKSVSLNGHKSLCTLIEKKGDIRYDARSSFSLWVNHRDTFTGITDNDRALTIRKIGETVDRVMKGKNIDFGEEFRSPICLFSSASFY